MSATIVSGLIIVNSSAEALAVSFDCEATCVAAAIRGSVSSDIKLISLSSTVSLNPAEAFASGEIKLIVTFSSRFMDTPAPLFAGDDKSRALSAFSAGEDKSTVMFLSDEIP